MLSDISERLLRPMLYPALPGLRGAAMFRIYNFCYSFCVPLSIIFKWCFVKIKGQQVHIRLFLQLHCLDFILLRSAIKTASFLNLSFPIGLVWYQYIILS